MKRKKFLGFWDTNRSLKTNLKARPYDNQQKKGNLPNWDFAVPADPRMKKKEKTKKDLSIWTLPEN